MPGTSGPPGARSYVRPLPTNSGSSSFSTETNRVLDLSLPRVQLRHSFLGMFASAGPVWQGLPPASRLGLTLAFRRWQPATSVALAYYYAISLLHVFSSKQLTYGRAKSKSIFLKVYMSPNYVYFASRIVNT